MIYRGCNNDVKDKRPSIYDVPSKNQTPNSHYGIILNVDQRKTILVPRPRLTMIKQSQAFNIIALNIMRTEVSDYYLRFFLARLA